MKLDRFKSDSGVVLDGSQHLLVKWYHIKKARDNYSIPRKVNLLNFKV